MSEASPYQRKEIIGQCTLYLGDCRDILPTLGKVDAVVTDPPYGMNWNTDTMRFSGGSSPNIKRGTKVASCGGDGHKPIKGDNQPFDPSHLLRWPCVIWGSNHFAQKLPIGKTLIWVKRHPDLFGTFLSDCEIAWASGGHGCYAFYKQFPSPTRAIEANGNPCFPTTVHPNQKPITLYEWSNSFVASAEIVLDPYMGSGSGGVACVNLGRKFIGIEIDEGYFNIACDRIRKAYAQPDMFIAPPAEKPKQEAFDGL